MTDITASTAPLPVGNVPALQMDSDVSLQMKAGEAADLGYWLLTVIERATHEAKAAPEGSTGRAIAEKTAADATALRERLRALLFIPLAN